MIKKIFLTVAVLGIMFAPVYAFCAPNIGLGSGGMTQDIAGKAGFDTSGDQYSLSRTVGGIIRAVLSVIGVLFLILTIYAGVLWMTASGNEEQVTKAKNIIKSSLIGLIIVLAAYGITALVFAMIIGAQAPSTDAGSYDVTPQLGCCVRNDDEKCTQTATQGACTAKWSDSTWYPSESCSPYIMQETGCDFEMSM
jgi:amino acid transporter